MPDYAVTAQFYDALAGVQHAPVDAQIAAALQGLSTSDGPVLDIGAGTGLTTAVIARALPDAAILAVEPDPAMRPALMTRVCSDHDLKRRVSILPMSILQAPLPATIAGAVLSASLVHFSPDQRAALWPLLAARLAPGARVIAEIQCPDAVDIPETCMATARIGCLDYEGRAQALRMDEQRQRWRMIYRTTLEGICIDRQSAEYICWTVSAARVVAEAALARLQATIIGDLVVMRRPPHAG